MSSLRAVCWFSALLLCSDGTPLPLVYGGPSLSQGEWRYIDVTATHLPPSTLDTKCLDAAFADVDGDGDLDVFLGNEYQENLLLENDGTGRLTDVSDDRIPRSARDSEDVAAFDFDRDGDIDFIIVSEDDRTNEYYLNGGWFSDHPSGLPVDGVSNAIAYGDVDNDHDIDLVIGNDGQNE